MADTTIGNKSYYDANCYEPKNSNIQTHVTAAHAPSNAQANADITKAEIEAKLTGAISTHTHTGGSVPDILTLSQTPPEMTSVATGYQAIVFGGYTIATSLTLVGTAIFRMI